MRFVDREHAGRLLAERLERLRGEDPVVVGLSRGGIPVAFEVARRLDAPLDLIVVRKILAPAAREPSIGAIAEGGTTFFNPTALHEGAIDPERAAALADAEISELARRVRLYRAAGPPARLDGRVAIVVDDFVSTGGTARAAARAARGRGARRVVLAVPVVPERLEPVLRAEFDELVAVETSSAAAAPSDPYERFEEVSDEVALGYLRRARLEHAIEQVEPAAIS